MPVPKVNPVIGHRGASAYAPENTLASFAKAKELGVKCVEFDVMLAGCGELVVIHDETLERTTNGAGRVIDFPYEYLKTLDAGAWFSPDFRGQYIPTLQEVLCFLQNETMTVNIEIKAQKGYEKIVVDKVIALLKKEWKNEFSALLLSSFCRETLYYLHQLSLGYTLGFLMHEWQTDWGRVCQDLNCAIIGVNCDILDAEKSQLIKSAKCSLLSYTINDNVLANKLFAMGVDAVFSDCPDRILNRED